MKITSGKSASQGQSDWYVASPLKGTPAWFDSWRTCHRFQTFAKLGFWKIRFGFTLESAAVIILVMQRVGPDLKMVSLKVILIWNLKIWSKTTLIEPDLIFSWLIRLMSRPEIGFRQFFKVKRNRQLCIHVLKKRSHIQLQRNILKNHSFKVSYSHHQGHSYSNLVCFVSF